MDRQLEVESEYVLGRSEAETQRLMVQAELYDRATHRFLEDAGVSAGMKVLDVGSGAGDVAFTAANIATAQEVDADTLAGRYRAEVLRTGIPFLMIPLVTARARKPAD